MKVQGGVHGSPYFRSFLPRFGFLHKCQKCWVLSKFWRLKLARGRTQFHLERLGHTNNDGPNLARQSVELTLPARLALQRPSCRLRHQNRAREGVAARDALPGQERLSGLVEAAAAECGLDLRVSHADLREQCGSDLRDLQRV